MRRRRVSPSPHHPRAFCRARLLHRHKSVYLLGALSLCPFPFCLLLSFVNPSLLLLSHRGDVCCFSFDTANLFTGELSSTPTLIQPLHRLFLLLACYLQDSGKLYQTCPNNKIFKSASRLHVARLKV